MKAVVVHEPGSARLENVPMPDVGRKDVLVKVGACGICGTDLHIIDGEFPPTRYPIIIGHEFGGTIVDAGTDLDKIALRRNYEGCSRKRSFDFAQDDELYGVARKFHDAPALFSSS